jgi:rRNA maturation RNase YbeY
LAKLTFQHELHRVIFHGALHLCGFGDKTPAQAKKMRALEEEWLLKYFEG